MSLFETLGIVTATIVTWEVVGRISDRFLYRRNQHKVTIWVPKNWLTLERSQKLLEWAKN